MSNMISNPTISYLTETAIKAAISAGNEILAVYYHSDFEVEFKSDNSPLTIADKRAHQVIIEQLNQTNIPVLSEEGKEIPFAERKNWNPFWLVDPLDGTKEFLKRNHEFTVNIALIKDNTPVIGVVYVPCTKQLYWANADGSFKASINENSDYRHKAQQLPLPNSNDAFIVVGSRSHMSHETEAFIKKLNTNGKIPELISKGSSLKICLVAEGNATVYPRLAPTMEWDTAAGHAIVKYAGKDIYQFDNKKPLEYNKESLVNPWFVVE
jgi:3'(2'), 5'-bisphosphate nucleotidase